MPGVIQPDQKKYIRIVQGSFVQRVDKGTVGARHRDGVTPEGTPYSVQEYVYMGWSGKLIAISFKEVSFGGTKERKVEFCELIFDDVTVSVPVDSNYFRDVAVKLCACDVTKELYLHPYSFDDGTGKVRRGVSVQQDGIKIQSPFWDGKNTSGGYPVVDKALKEKLKDKYWVVFFSEVSEFCKEKLKEIDFPEPPHIDVQEYQSIEDVPTDLPWEEPND